MKKFTKKQLKAMVMTAAVIVPMTASGIAGVQEVAAAPKAAVTRNVAAEKVNLQINKLAMPKNTPGVPTFNQNADDGSTALQDWIAANSAVPLAGVTFEIWKLAAEQKPSSVAKDSAAEEALMEGATKIGTVVTDDSGKIATEVVNKGSYLIREIAAPAEVVEHSDSMIVTLPIFKYTQNNTTEFVNNTVDVYMKNRTNTGSVSVDKLIEDNTASKEVTFKLTKTHDQKGNLLAEPIEVGSVDTDGSVINGEDFGWDNLTYGTYELEETAKVSEDYQNISKKTFVIDETHQAVEFLNDNKIENFLRPEITKTIDGATEGKTERGVILPDSNGLVSAGVNVGDSFDWHLNTNIPANIKEMSEFFVSDTMPAQISYNDAQIYIVDNAVYSTDDAPKTGALEEGVHYNASTSEDGQKVKYDFTAAGLAEMAKNTDGVLYIKYNTTLNTLDGLDEVNSFNFVNGARVDWTVKNAPETGNDTDTSESWTGAKKFQKTNETGAALAGAEFVVKNAAGAYLAYGENKEVSWSTSVDEATVFSSGTTTPAPFEVEGLAAGQYSLVETKTPEGFVTMADKPFTISRTDGAAEGLVANLSSINVENVSAKRLPLTGGMGYIAAAIGGLAAMFMAVRGYRRIK